MSCDFRLLILARAPEPGRGKTRLAAELGVENAAEAYRIMAGHTVAAARAAGVAVTVCHTPAKAGPDMAAWFGPDLDYQAQAEGDLGARLELAMRQAFASGAATAAVIGTDAPGLRPEHIMEARQRLTETDFVLGPAQDGGYWLLGARREAFFSGVFQGMPWSAPELLEVTLRVLAEAGKSASLLGKLRDVDTRADLWHIIEESKESAIAAPVIRKLAALVSGV